MTRATRDTNADRVYVDLRRRAREEGRETDGLWVLPTPPTPVGHNDHPRHLRQPLMTESRRHPRRAAFPVVDGLGQHRYRS
jgi:hypothetical protein